jgi:hypothetical protein
LERRLGRIAKAIAMNGRHFDIGALEADIEGGMS